MPSDPPWLLGHDNGQTGAYRDPPTTHAPCSPWPALASRCASAERATAFTPPAEEPHRQSRRQRWVSRSPPADSCPYWDHRHRSRCRGILATRSFPPSERGL